MDRHLRTAQHNLNYKFKIILLKWALTILYSSFFSMMRTSLNPIFARKDLILRNFLSQIKNTNSSRLLKVLNQLSRDRFTAFLIFNRSSNCFCFLVETGKPLLLANTTTFLKGFFFLTAGNASLQAKC